MTGSAPKKYMFETEFDDEGAVSWQAPRPKTAYTPEEVEQIRVQAFAEGERSVTAQAEQNFASSLQMVVQAIEQALPALAQVAHDHRTGAAELALAAGRQIADAALAKFPEAPVAAALVELAREVEAVPRLNIRVAGDQVERVQATLTEVAQQIGYPGAVVVVADAVMTQAAFSLDWGEGRAVYDPEAAAQRIGQALHTALAAEGLHAEPLIPAPDAQDLGAQESETDHG